MPAAVETDAPKPGYRFWSLYGFGDEVHLRGRADELPGLVTGVFFRPGGSTAVEVGWSDATSSTHYPFELSDAHTPSY